MWILAAQSAAYIVGAVSWIYAERTGFLAYGRYMLRFARDNRHKTKLLGDKEARERVEPFLTGETFYRLFPSALRDRGRPAHSARAHAQRDRARHPDRRRLAGRLCVVFVVLFLMQWTMRKRVASAYRENQRMTNRMTAQGYTAWDNVFAGNRYNLRLWLRRLQEQAARRAGRADPRHHDQGGPERGERHHRPGDRVRRDGASSLSATPATWRC